MKLKPKLKLPVIKPHPLKSVFEKYQIPLHLIGKYVGMSASSVSLYFRGILNIPAEALQRLETLADCIEKDPEKAEAMLEEAVNQQ